MSDHPCPQVRVSVAQTGDCFDCATNESLLAGMLRLGRKGIPAGCVNGGCGVCKVRIVEGSVQPLGPVSRAHVSAEEEACGYTLACRVTPTQAVRLEVSPKLRKPFWGGATPVAAPPVN
ncbi:MAG: 2Fe-2S iron-sulfur cluster-binding protein [Burkholderiaceae bacterium]|nr:2Fe-2S iron-sulfur cluster-binding protein [Burkholderiaceae bacterium]